MKSELFLYLLGLLYGFNMRNNHRFVKETEYWTSKQWDTYHEEKLHIMIEHAYNHVPFYHQLFEALHLLPSDIKNVKDLEKLPIVRKCDIIAHQKDFIADNADKYPHVQHHTGGTTGIPCPYYNDRQSWALNWAIKMRTFEWAGYHYGKDCLAVMAGGSLIPGRNSGIKHKLWRWINNYYSMPITHMTPKIMTEYAQQIRLRKIQFMRGYPTAITTFADFLLSQNETLPMRAIFTTAEMLYPHQRILIRKAFCCEVYDTYGCGDGMGHATDCEKHTGLHISQEVSIMQIVDEQGHEVTPGEEGEIVLTSLYDFSMPLIRYAPGDKAMKGKSECQCGRTLPKIERIIGRSSDSFKFSNGRILNGLSIPIEDLTQEVDKFQIVQEEKDKVVLYIIPRSEITQQMQNDFKSLLEFHCGDGVSIDVKVVDHIDIPSSGKHRYIISKVNN